MSFSENHLVLDALRACQSSYHQSTFEGDGVEVLYLQGQRCDLMAFRGTEGSGDAFVDVRTVPWTSPVGLVHSGFYKGVRTIMPKVLEYARKDRPIVFTGHSKGGAEANIAAGLCVVEGAAPAGLITFGSPRCGFPKLSRVLKGVYKVRCVNANDAVPSHPWPIWGWRHTSDEVNINEKSQGRYDDHLLASYLPSAEEYFG